MTSDYCVVYDPVTGRILSSGITDNPDERRQAGSELLLGVLADVLTQRVVRTANGPTVVDLPPRPSIHHEFDYHRDQWVLPPERAAFLVRLERDRLLAASDWTQLPDIPEETKLKWQAYRQALRDLTSQHGFPERVEWPTAPG